MSAFTVDDNKIWTWKTRGNVFDSPVNFANTGGGGALVVDSPLSEAKTIVGTLTGGNLVSIPFGVGTGTLTWTTVSGFTVSPATVTYVGFHLSGVGVVNWTGTATPAVGSNVATLTIPFPIAANFANTTSASGLAVGTAANVTQSGTITSTNAAQTVTVTFVATSAAATLISGQFSYILT
jgi:hypothetical protein